jgi:hypothetical protein
MIVVQPVAAVRLNELLGLQIVSSKTRVLGHASEHARANLFALMEGKDVIGIATACKRAVLNPTAV